MADVELDVVAAAHGFVGGNGLERDRQTQCLRERGSHDDQGQAISRPRGKSLCRVPGHDRVVFDLELPLAVYRVDKAFARAFGRELPRDLHLEEVLHLRR